MAKRLFRSRTDRMLAGVCGGLAEYLGADATIVRVIAVILALVTGVAILAYIIMAIVVPLEGSKAARPGDTVRENVEEIKGVATDLGHEIRTSFAGGESSVPDEVQRRRRNTAGMILIILGVVFLLFSFNVFGWFGWGKLWPLIIIIIGAAIIWKAARRS